MRLRHIHPKHFNLRHIALATLLLGVGSISCLGVDYRDASAAVDERVEDLLRRMTLHEKVLQLRNHDAGRAGEIDNTFHGESWGSTHEMGMRYDDCARHYSELDSYMRNNTRLGIPMINCVEGIQGILQNGCTLFPHALAQASTFNPELVTRMTEAAANEARSMGIRQVLSPVLDVARELRWGRIEETFGEDPYLISEMACAFVDGYQKNGVNCMPKHFAAHGSPSGGLNCASVAGGPREFRSIYLYPFEKVISRCNPLAIMTCYSSYDGEPMTGSRYYMTDVLRGELGFEGYVYSDWGSVERLMTFHHAVATREEAAMMALIAGVDIDVDWVYETLESSVEKGLLDESYIDTAVRRVLRTKFLLGLFDEPYDTPEAALIIVHSPQNIALAKEVADESLVLVENKNQILPLDLNKYKKIALVGPNAKLPIMGDYAWTNFMSEEGTGLLQGLTEAVGNKAEITYAEGCNWWQHNDTTGIADAVRAVEESDVAIVALGTRSTFLGRGPRYSTAGEGFDLSSLELPGAQAQLFDAVCATGKPVIVVFLSGKPLAIPQVQEKADAVLVQWYAGECQGQSMADAILGNINPSGKLNVSFPRSTGNTPCFYNHYPTDREEPFDQPGTPDEPKGHYIFDIPEPIWNFGHGLSYTTFEFGELSTDKETYAPSDTIIVRVPLKNTGSRTGKEVVQLYVRDLVSSVATPMQQLRGFQKVELTPEESSVVEIALPIEELAIYDHYMHKVVEPGEFELQIGSASDNIVSRKTITVK